jgi:hypothetical protein
MECREQGCVKWVERPRIGSMTVSNSLLVQIMHTNYILDCSSIKTIKIIKAAPTSFGLHKPSSGSHSQLVAKITMLVPMYLL